MGGDEREKLVGGQGAGVTIEEELMPQPEPGGGVPPPCLS